MLFEITFAVYLVILAAVVWEDLRLNKDAYSFKA